MACVLIVDDEPDVLEVLRFNFRQAGFETLVARDGAGAISEVRRRAPDLVLLDVMLPDIPGTEVCRQLHADPATRDVPVVLLTARTGEADRVAGLELGADDYVTKPFSPREVVLRARAVLRRASGRLAVARSEVGPIRLDRDAHRCYVEGVALSLTPIEFGLLALLVAKAGMALSRDQLLQEVWKVSGDIETRTIDTHVKRLRDRLGPARELLETVRGIGYRLVDPNAS